MSSLFELFYTFAKIGLFTFGGGYAMIPIIENVCVEKKEWISQEDMLNITAIAESTPGPVAINCATFVGYKQKGVVGAIAATLGVTLPSMVIIFAIALFFRNLLSIKIIADAFSGIRLAVGILILGAAIKMISKIKKDPLSVIFIVIAAAVMLAADYFAIPFVSNGLIVVSAVASLVITAVRKYKGGPVK